LGNGFKPRFNTLKRLKLLLHFIILGLLGGLAYVFIHTDDLEDLGSFQTLRYLVLSAITGYLYDYLYSEHNWPNSVMAFVSGYFAVDFIEGLVVQARRRLSPSDGF